MSHALRSELERWLATRARELDVPGVAVGVLADGVESYAFHGVTSVENPLPVDAETLFQIGSTTKTFTATALMRLVERGDVDLGATVRTYVPELRLRDEDAARRVTVLQLLNHTAGWQGDATDDTGEGDDAVARFVTAMAELEQVTPLGTAFSYNNASVRLAGRVIERVTGGTYEAAIEELLFRPLGMEHSWFFANDIMTRRFAAGHHRDDDGRIAVVRHWALPRRSHPSGGIASTAADQIRWARFHLGDGRAPDGTRLLGATSLARMREPTVDVRGSAMGDAIGISWMLRDVDGVRVVAHGGATDGHYSMFEMVPERGFAITSLTNCGPNGNRLNDELLRWALEAYLGVADRDPEPVPLPAGALAAYAGRYETIAAVGEVRVEGGGLALSMRARDGDEPGQHLTLGLLAGDGDRYVVTGGPGAGMRGYFVRDGAGRVVAIHLGGRLAFRPRPREEG